MNTLILYYFISYSINNITWSVSQPANYSTGLRWHRIIIFALIWLGNCWLSVGSFVIHTCKLQSWWPSILGFLKTHIHLYFTHPMTIPPLLIISNFTIYFSHAHHQSDHSHLWIYSSLTLSLDLAKFWLLQWWKAA